MTHIKGVWDLVFVPLVLLGKGRVCGGGGGKDHIGLSGVLWVGHREITTVISFPQVKQIITSQPQKQKALLSTPKSRNQV